MIARFCTAPFTLYAFLVVLFSLEPGQFVTKANNDAFVTAPQTIYAGRENLVSVRTLHPNTRVSVSMHVDQLSGIPQDTTSYETQLQDDGWYSATIPYHVPFLLITERNSVWATLNFTLTQCTTPVCAQFTQQHLTASVSIRQTPVHVLGETDKPIYRPGENVRFRFLALTPQLLWPYTKSALPVTKKLVSTEGNTLQLVDLEGGDVVDQSAVLFEEISVTDASDTRVKQWLDVPPREAFLLNYTLLADAPTGLWMVTARLKVGPQTVVEQLKFTVKPYVLPRFTISMEQPKHLSFDSTHAQFAVCARYTNGPALYGSVRAHLCVCSKQDSESVAHQASMLEDQACVAPRWRPERRPCVPVIGSLSIADGCARFNISTKVLALTDTRYPMWSQVPVVCAHVEEQGTGSNVSRCEPGSETVQQNRAKLEISGLGLFKRDLPVVGTVRLTHPDLPNLENATIRLLAEEVFKHCFQRLFAPPRSADTTQYRHVQLLRTDRNGVASFSIPPVKANRAISLRATYSPNKFTDRGFTSSSSDSQLGSLTVIGPRPSPPKPPLDVTGDKTIEAWMSHSALSMMVWPSLETVQVTCPGRVQLQLLANTPLNSRTLYVQTVVRGQHLSHVIPASDELDACVDRDDQLGHYRCIDSSNPEEIECLPGWTGDNCLIPTCSQGCSSPGGVCSSPEQCTCFEYWSGARCDRCMERDQCNRAAVQVEQVSIGEDSPPESESVTIEPATGPDIIPKEVKPRRTLHLRNISFPVDGNWGPEATVVIFFLDQAESSSNVVPVNVPLKDMTMCTSPAMAMEASQLQSGLSVSQRKVSPGQEVTLTLVPQGLDPPEINPGSMMDQTCFVRMQDISLDNFEGQKNLIDLKAVHDLVVDEKPQCCSPEPDSIDQAFRVAGLRIMSTTSLEVIRPMPCPYATFSRTSDLDRFSSPRMESRSHGPTSIDNYVDDSNWIPAQKPRLRDFFPEVWLFDYYPIEWTRGWDASKHNVETHGLVKKTLTVPDSITSWRAAAFCTTASNGLWIPQATELTTSMPFFVEITLPKQVKRGEILYLPISVFVSRLDKEGDNPTEAPDDKDCLAVSVQAELDASDWAAIGSQSYTDCVCPGEKRTFQLGMIAQRLGALNVTVDAVARTQTALCSEQVAVQSDTSKTRAFSDRIRRAISVEPEGVRQDFGMGDILCLSDDSPFTSAEFPISLADTTHLVPDSLRVYLTYSDEVLGPALANPDKLVRLPIGCGEQNMVLVAPNVYVLDYFKSTGTSSLSAVDKLARTARTHILTGYQRQLSYRHDDGSYSAFGKSDAEGSTWLTAFVLRVFAKAYRVDPSLQIDWANLFSETAQFLKQRQNATTGCFYELGRVLHSGMQGAAGTGGADEKAMLLTAYILSAIVETKPDGAIDHSPEFSPMINAGLKCLHDVYGLDQLETVNHLSTYALAQLAYTFVLTAPQTEQASLLQQELVRRQQHSTTQGVSHSVNFWLAQESSGSAPAPIGALDVETTSYALLTFSKLGVSTNELFRTVRWLSSQQKLEGGFFSTQDTVLGLEAIAQFAKRLGLANQSRTTSPLDVQATLLPAQYTLRDSVTVAKQRVSNQFTVPIALDPSELQRVLWNVSSVNSTRGCLAVHTSLIYNVAESFEQDQAIFQMTSTVQQAREPPVNACTTASLSICLTPNRQNPQTTGMLLVKVPMISGWKPIPTEILQQVRADSESPRQIEFAHDDTVSVYFDGFGADAESNPDWAQTATRCVKLALEQLAYVEQMKPAQIEAMDYYATHVKLAKQYTLNDCRGAWLPESGDADPMSTSVTQSTAWTTTEPRQLHCPLCVLDGDGEKLLMDNLLKYVCSGWSNLFVVRMHQSVDEKHSVTLSSIGPGRSVSSWNTTLIMQDDPNCSCVSLVSNATLIWISPNSNLPIEPGTREIAIQSFDPQALLIPVDEAWPSIDAARTEWKAKHNESSTFSPSFRAIIPMHTCSRIDILWRYIKSKLM